MSKDERDDEYEWLSRPDHPLLNSVILTIVFKHVRRRDLTKCRMVCKKWNVSTIPYTRKTSSITVYEKPCWLPPWLEENPGRGTIQNFMEVFRSNELGIPFGRFRLGSFCTTEGIGQEFLQLCGNVIKQINFAGDDYIIEDLSELLKSTPKLEELQIPRNLRSRSGDVVKLFPGPEDSIPKLTCLKVLNICHDNREERNRFCPTFLEEIFRSVNLIDSMSLAIGGFNPGSSLDVLSLIEELGRESTIQELRLEHGLSDNSEYIQILRKMTLKPDGLKLKTFQYELMSHDPEAHTLFQLVSLFKDTLEVLKIEGNGRSCLSFTNFLKMPHLTRLSIESFRSYNFNSKCVNLNKIFPVLKELQLFHNDFHRPDYVCSGFFPDSEPCPNLNAFSSSIIFHMNEFNQMLNIFPHLTKLSLQVGEDGAAVLRQIWSQMGQLNYLSIHGTLKSADSVDSILTGISTNTLHEIKDAVDNIDNIPTKLERRDMIMRLMRQHSQLPSVGNLSHLKSLSLSLTGPSRDDWYEFKDDLTNLTGYLCLYSMELLKNIQLYNCQFTKKCCEILTKDLGLQTWTFKTLQGEGGIHVIPPEQN